jgi:hypothetical protein
VFAVAPSPHLVTQPILDTGETIPLVSQDSNLGVILQMPFSLHTTADKDHYDAMGLINGKVISSL